MLPIRVTLQSAVHLTSILETRTERIEHWADEAACDASAATLASRAGIVDAFIELHGPLGAGKTTFARHLLHALGVEGRVKSPTYAVMEPYEVLCGGSPLAIWHFDFYRFESPQEFEDAGFRELFASRGLKLAEWPEQAAGLLPVADLQVHIEPLEGDARRVRFEAATVRGLGLIA
jgi:tRNA threonylcarbamoyladenosine biosynthesis protein TsaE